MNNGNNDKNQAVNESPTGEKKDKPWKKIGSIIAVIGIIAGIVSQLDKIIDFFGKRIEPIIIHGQPAPPSRKELFLINLVKLRYHDSIDDSYTKNWSQPMPVASILTNLQAGWQVDCIIPYCFASINNVRGISPEMSDLVALWQEFYKYNAIRYTFEAVTEEAPKSKETAFITLDREKAPTKVEEFQKLLDLDKNLKKYQVIPGIPPKKANLDKIYVRSRSVYQVLYMLANFIDVPTSQKNWVWPSVKPLKWRAIPHFHVMTTPGLLRPDEFAAIKYKGNWFYIHNEDTDTKRVFSGLMEIFSMMETAP
jgi:hypothetical protein